MPRYSRKRGRKTGGHRNSRTTARRALNKLTSLGRSGRRVSSRTGRALGRTGRAAYAGLRSGIGRLGRAYNSISYDPTAPNPFNNTHGTGIYQVEGPPPRPRKTRAPSRKRSAKVYAPQRFRSAPGVMYREPMPRSSTAPSRDVLEAITSRRIPGFLI